MRPNACRASQENKENTVFHGFFVLTFKGHSLYQKFKRQRSTSQLHPSIHAEIKLLYLLVKEGRHDEKKNNFKNPKKHYSCLYSSLVSAQAEVDKEDPFKGVRKVHSSVKRKKFQEICWTDYTHLRNCQLRRTKNTPAVQWATSPLRYYLSAQGKINFDTVDLPV